MARRIDELLNRLAREHESSAGYERTATLVGRWLTHLRALGRSAQTIDGYRGALGKYLQLAPALGIPDDPASVGRHHIVAFLAALADSGQSTYTVYNRWASLSAFFGWLVEERYVRENPCARLRPKRDEEPIPLVRADQMRDLMLLCQDDSLSQQERRDMRVLGREAVWGSLHEGLRNWAIFMTLRGTGIRAGELVALLLSDLDLDSGELTVRHGKGGKSRRLHLEDPVLLAVWRYIDRARGTAPGPLFLARGGKHARRPEHWRPLLRTSLTQLCQRYGARAGFDLHPHMFRHTFAVSYLLAGGDVRTLQIILGHESLDMVMRYVRAIEQMDAVAKHRELRPLSTLHL